MGQGLGAIETIEENTCLQQLFNVRDKTSAFF